MIKVAPINLPEGNHHEVLITSDLHRMIKDWTEITARNDKCILTEHGLSAGKPVDEVVPTLCYARISLSEFGLCSIAVAQVGDFDPIEFGKRCEAIAREQIERCRAATEMSDNL